MALRIFSVGTVTVSLRKSISLSIYNILPKNKQNKRVKPFDLTPEADVEIALPACMAYKPAQPL